MTTIKQTLVELFELEKMSPEKGAEMVERLGKLVFQAVLMRVLPTLSKEDMAEYNKLSASLDAVLIFNFLNEKVPNFEKIIEEEASNLKQEMEKDMKDAGI